MSEQWETVEIVEGEVDSKLQPVTVGLAAEPMHLHSEHLSGASHLSEVRDMHTKLLVTAGELPESNLADIHPERSLKWMVEELGGTVGQRAVSIPLKGTTLGRVELYRGELHGHPAMKLNLLDIHWEKTIPLPEEVGQLTATWDSGNLVIEW